MGKIQSQAESVVGQVIGATLGKQMKNKQLNNQQVKNKFGDLRKYNQQLMFIAMQRLQEQQTSIQQQRALRVARSGGNR